MPILALRGATTIDTDSENAMREALNRLLTALCAHNPLVEERVVSILMTVTGDIRSASPARCVRELLGWQQTAILCSVEPEIDGMPERCIRLLIQFEGDPPPGGLRHAYQGEAKALRPDWAL